MPHTGDNSLLQTCKPSNPWCFYQPIIWLLAITSSAGWLAYSAHIGTHELVLTWLLALLGNVADIKAVTLQKGMRVSTAHFAAPFAIIVAGIPAGILVAATCLFGRRIIKRDDWNIFDIAVNLTATSVAGAVWQLGTTANNDAELIVGVATVTIYAAIRAIINAGWAAESRSRGVDISPIAVPVGKLMLAAALLFTPAVVLLHLQQDSLVSTVVLLVLPFVATQFLITSFGRARALNADLEKANITLTESLVNALDARDPYSAGHSMSVAIFSRDIAREIGLSEYEIQRIHLAGLLHDVGKISVPDAILRKPSALTDDEFDEIRKHPAIGEQILAPNKYMQDILPAVRHHHERIDGKGYPDRLRDTEIPLEARIIAVADAYDAMTSDRPYRDAMSPTLARHVLTQNQGMQHDPFLVSAFLRVLDAKGIVYATRNSKEFSTRISVSDLVEELSAENKRAA